MAMTPHNLINRIKRKAAKTDCRFQIAALGFNRKNQCVIAKFNWHRYMRKHGGLHAEASVMMEAKRLGIVRIVIGRISRTGKLLPIEPCEKCQRLAQKLGIKIETIRE
jgi:hypothetical protein